MSSTISSTATASTTPNLAPRVCAACKRRKKKCDKQLPSCTSCITQRTTCDYRDDKDIPGIADDLRSLRKWLRRAESSMLVLNNRSSPHSSSPDSRSLDKLSPGNLTSLLPDFLIWQHDDEHLRVRQIHEILYRRTCQIFDLGGDTIYDVCDLYFRSVHSWLPVISRELFYVRLQACQGIPQADVALLLLSIYLLIQIPTDDPEARDHQHQLYQTAKYFCTGVQTLMPSSIGVIQAKLLVATYEHTSGKCEAAYLTIGDCTRSGFLMGLDRPSHSNHIIGSDDFLRAAEKKNLWWGIVTSERIIVLETQIFGRPMATQAPDSKYGLPIDLDHLDVLITTGYETSFTREALASRLLDEVISFSVSNSIPPSPSLSSSSSTCAEDTLFEATTPIFTSLDRKLHNFLNFLMDPASGAWGTFCGSTAIIVSGFFVLHRNRKALATSHHHNHHSHQYTNPANPNTQSPNPTTTTTLRTEQTQLCTLALSTATRIVLDVIRKFMLDLHLFDIKAIPPGYTSIIFQGAMNHITASDYLGTNEWQEDLELFRRSCFYMSHRWRIARDYLTLIDSAASAVSPVPLEDFGEFVMPNGSYNGLC